MNNSQYQRKGGTPRKSKKPISEERLRKLNNIDGYDFKKLQFTSVILETMKDDGQYNRLCKSIASMAYNGKGKDFIITILRQRFPQYCGRLTLDTFNKWLKFYPEINEAFYFNREDAIGELATLGMRRARHSVDVGRDDFIIKFGKALSAGELDAHREETLPKNIIDDPNICNQAKLTFNRINLEAERFGGIENVKVEDDVEDGED